MKALKKCSPFIITLFALILFPSCEKKLDGTWTGDVTEDLQKKLEDNDLNVKSAQYTYAYSEDCFKKTCELSLKNVSLPQGGMARIKVTMKGSGTFSKSGEKLTYKYKKRSGKIESIELNQEAKECYDEDDLKEDIESNPDKYSLEDIFDLEEFFADGSKDRIKKLEDSNLVLEDEDNMEMDLEEKE